MMRAWCTIDASEDMDATVLEKTCRGGQDKVEKVVVTGQVATGQLAKWSSGQVNEEEWYWEAKVVVE